MPQYADLVLHCLLAQLVEILFGCYSCGPMMLDVLFKIKDDQDHSLAFRRSCRLVYSMRLPAHVGSACWLLLA